MTAYEFERARIALGLTYDGLAAMLGFAGASRRSAAWKLATGRQPVADYQARLIAAYLEGYRPADWPVKKVRKKVRRRKLIKMVHGIYNI